MTDRRLLVVGPSWVGDMIMAQSLFLFLRSQGVATIDVLAPAWSVPVLARMPEINEAVTLDAGHGEVAFGKRRQMGRMLRGRGYTQSIVLPRSLKAALVPWFAEVPQRTGYRGELRYGLINDMRPFDPQLLDQTVKRFVMLGSQDGQLPDRLPQPRLQVDLAAQKELRECWNLHDDRPLIALMPGAEYGPAKCWPLQHFRELADKLLAAGYAVIVLGSHKERRAGDFIAADNDAKNLCGETTLTDAIDLLACSVHAVSNDSGLMHVAAACGTTVHALYGSSSPDFTPPLTDRSHIYYQRLECSPCFKRECPLGHLNCLVSISPESVFKSVENAD